MATIISEAQVQDAFTNLLFDHDLGGERNPGAAQGTCYYTHPITHGHCVAGMVLHLLGVPVPNEENGSINTCAISGGPFADWLSTHDYALSNEAERVLAEVQGKADTNYTWGEAIAVVYPNLTNPYE
jgi:hypothetical protein